MTPYYYEIFDGGDYINPGYKGIVLATDDIEARDKVEHWYFVRHGQTYPDHVRIHETIE